MKINEIGTFAIYGHSVACRILAIREGGTVDVERLSDGNCFRLTGLPVIRPSRLGGIKPIASAVAASEK